MYAAHNRANAPADPKAARRQRRAAVKPLTAEDLRARRGNTPTA